MRPVSGKRSWIAPISATPESREPLLPDAPEYFPLTEEEVLEHLEQGLPLDRAYFDNVDLRGRSLKNVSLRGALLQKVDLSGVDLSGADLSNAVFSSVNLTR